MATKGFPKNDVFDLETIPDSEQSYLSIMIEFLEDHEAMRTEGRIDDSNEWAMTDQATCGGSPIEP